MPATPQKTRDQSPYLPASVAVTFVPTWNDDGPIGATMPRPYVVTVPIVSILPAAVAGSGASSALTGVASATKTFHSTAQALFTQASPTTPSNASALATLANRIAQDYYSWRVVGFDRAYAGIVGHAQDGFTDSVTWTYSGDDRVGPSTRAFAPIGNDDPEELAHSDAPPWLPTAQVYAVISTTTFNAAVSGDQMSSGMVKVRTTSYSGALTSTSSPALVFKAWQKDSSSAGAVAVGENLLVSRDDASGKYIISWRQCG